MRGVLLSVALCLATSAHADAPSVEKVVADLGRSASTTKTLRGEFVQRNKVKLFKQELRSTGKLYFEAPRRIRWEYLEPDPSTMILNGQKATLKTLGAEAQVFDLSTDATMRTVFDQLLLWLGAGAPSLDGDYVLTTAGTAAAPVLVLAPKAGSTLARAFSRIELRVDGKSGLLSGLKMVERSGDEKDIAFVKLERNVTLPPNLF